MLEAGLLPGGGDILETLDVPELGQAGGQKEADLGALLAGAGSAGFDLGDQGRHLQVGRRPHRVLE